MKSYDGACKLLMAVYNAWAHIWAADGSHAGWRSVDFLVMKARVDLGRVVASSTMARWLKREKDEYDAGRGLRQRPDLAALIMKMKGAAESVAEDVIVKDMPQSAFGAHLFPQLIAQCNEMVDIAGFGVHVVAAFASDIYHDSLAIGEGEPADVWVPSDEWCYWFMHAHLNLVPRRITSHDTASPEQVALQQRLHDVNVETIAIARHEGLPDWAILGSDEFGMHIFPYDKVKWERKGAQRVASDLPEDKRQYTGDIVHNSAGDIVVVEQIWAGKTPTSLPPQSVQEHFKGRMMFDLSLNHWANHDTKLRLLQAAWAWVKKRWAEECLVGDPRCIYLLDCWPVNLTERLRDAVKLLCPGMQLLFIPAGATGKYQVNDTHMHKPLKDTNKRAAHAWRIRKILVFRKQRDAAVAGGADPAAQTELFSKKVAALLKIKVLRAHSPYWLWEGCEALLLAIAGEDRNIIRKGWEQLYFEPASAPGFVAEAYNRRNARQRAAADAELQRRLAAAQAAAAAAAPEDVAAAAAATGAEPLDELVAAVAALEQPLHEGEVPKIKALRRTKGGAARHARPQAARPRAVLDGDAAAAADGSTAGAVAGGPAAELTSELLAPLSLKQLRGLCGQKEIATYGNKSVLVARLLAWKPGDKPSKRGRRPGSGVLPAAKKPAVGAAPGVTLPESEPPAAPETDAEMESQQSGDADASEEDGDESSEEEQDALADALAAEAAGEHAPCGRR